jgi:hypothetical protein
MTVRREEIRVTADVANAVSRFGLLGRSAHNLADDLEAADSRLANFVQTGLAITPALVPLGASALPAIAGVTTELGFLVGAIGTTVIAFQGMGDAVKALNDYRIAPTQKNLDKLHQAMDSLSPKQARFALFLDEHRDKIERLKGASSQIFPGMEEGLTDLMQRMPEFDGILSEISSTMGDLIARGGKSLAGPEWDDFFTYLEDNARPILTDTFESVGLLAHGLTELWMAVDPLSQDFSRGFKGVAEDFDNWASSIDASDEGLQSLIDYIDEVGPRAWEALSAIASAGLDIVEAAAPVGSVALPVIEALADSLAAVARSDAGPIIVSVAAGIGLLGRSLAILNAVGLRGGAPGEEGILARTIGVSQAKGAVAAIRDVTDATKELEQAQGNLARVGARTREAQYALIPDTQKRAAIRDYVTAQQQVKAATDKVTEAEQLRKKAILQSAGTAARTASVIGGLALSSSGLIDSLGVANSVSLGLMGSLAGPYGAAAGIAAGAMLDAAAANDDFTDSVKRADDALRDTPTAFAEQQKAIDQTRQKYIELYDYLNDSNKAGMFGPDLNDFRLGDLKNTAEDVFGTSDIQEAEDEYYRLAKQFDVVTLAWSDLGNAISDRPHWIDQTDDLDALARVAERAGPALDALGVSVEDVGKMDVPELVDLAEQIRSWNRAQEGLPGRTRSVRDAMEELDDEVISTTDATEDLAKSLEGLFSPDLDAEAATDAWIAGLREMRKELHDIDDPFGDSKKGLENKELTRDAAQNIQDMLVAKAKAGASSRELKNLLKDSREELIKEGVAAGISREAMEKRTREIGLTPKLIRTLFRVDTEKADQKVRSLREMIDGLNGKTFKFTLQGTTIVSSAKPPGGGGRYTVNADGNILERAPRIGDQQPQLRMYTGPAGIVWSEEGSGPWEAFISGHPAKLQRSRAIAEDVVSRLGGRAQFYADGGMLERAYAAGARQSSRSGGPVAPVEAHLTDAAATRIAQRLGQLRPLYGDLHVHGDGSAERTLQQEWQAAGGGGTW